MRWLLLILSALLPTTPVEASHIFHDAAAVKILPAPAACGIFQTWAAVDFALREVEQRAYLRCATIDDIPLPGARCTVELHRGVIEGLTPDGTRTPFEGLIIDRMTCTPPIGG